MKKKFENLRRKSYFSMLIKYFLMVFCIPIIIIILMNIMTQSLIKRQILLSNRDTLTQFFELVDATVEEMKEVCIHLAYDTTCQNYANSRVLQSEREPYLRYEMKQTIGSLKRNGVKDVFLYFPEDNRIISGVNSSLMADRYYEAYYEEKGNDFLDEFYLILNCESVQPAFCVMNSEAEKPYLCVAVKSVSVTSNRKSYTVVVVLEQEYLSQILFHNDDENIIMFDGKGKMLLNANRDGVIYTLDGYEQGEEIFETRINGVKYIIQVQESRVLKGYYASVVSYRYFWQQMYSLQAISVAGILGCIILGGWMVYKGSRKSYQPVEEMLNQLQKNADDKYDVGLSTEFDFIVSVFQRENEEKRKLQNYLRRQRKNEKEQKLEYFLISLLEGKVNGDILEDDVFAKNEMYLYSDKFFVGILKLDIQQKMEWEEKTFIIKNVFKEVTDRKHQGYIVQSVNDYFIIIINLKVPDKEEELVAIFEEGKNFLEKHYEMVFTIGMSRIHEGMLSIPVCYKEAQRALKYQFIFGRGAVIAYNEIVGRKFFNRFMDEINIYQKVEEFISGKAKEKKADVFVSRILDLYGIDENISIETIECVKFDILNVVNKLLISKGFAVLDRQSIVEELMSQETLEEFKIQLLMLMTNLYDREQELIKQNDVCAQARKYIDEKYMDAQLSVSVLGEKLKISPSYLSKLFKEKYEVSILDYIAMVRISHAKDMLGRKTLKLDEVAEQNGFLSSNVFIKTFKKCEGITPGRYREFLF